MKKNRMMRLAALLLVCVLMTTSVIGGTFAKYTTSVDSEDSARVAYWGFQSSNAINLTGLFTPSYTNVNAQNAKDVIAPGTSGSATFAFAYDETVKANGSDLSMTGPEVTYDFTITVDAVCDEKILNNKNIVWKLDDTDTELTWEQLIAKIVELSGATGVTGVANGQTTKTVQYTAGNLPAAFATTDTPHTIYWEWKFGNEANAYTGTYDVAGVAMNQDQYDTYMGNMDEMDDVSISITITATQVN